MSQWYCQHSGKVAGPLSLDELAFLRDRGKLTPDSQLRQGEHGTWVAAKTVHELFQPAETTALDGTTAEPSPRAPAARLEQPHPATPDPSAIFESPPAVRPPVPSTREHDSNVRQSVMIGSSIGAGVILLILLILLLLRFGGQGVAARSESRGTPGPAAQGESDDGPGGTTSDGGGQVAQADGAGDDEQGTEQGGLDGPAETAGEPDEDPVPRPQAIIRLRPLTGDLPADKGTGSGKATTGAGDGRLGGRAGGSNVSEFFGLKASGKKFVYVVDCSGSMRGRAFGKACDELLKSIEGLNSGQSFYVFFFDDKTYNMFHPQPANVELIKATAENVKRVRDWVATFQVAGGTDPHNALLQALKLEPNAIYMLTDGDIEGSVVDDVTKRNARKSVIHTIGFVGRSGEALLQEMAERNRGDYRFVP